MLDSASGNEELIQVKEAVRKKFRSENHIGTRALVEESRARQHLKDTTSGMLLVCDVLCAGSIDVPSYGTDWYWVLQVPPSADTATIESQHSKLTAALEELVKEEFRSTAETALRLVRDAYAVLVDAERRSVFDQRRSSTWKQFYELVSSNKHVDLDGNRGETQAGIEASSAGSLLSSLGMKRHGNVEAGAVSEDLDPVALEKEASAARKGKRICTEDDKIHPGLSESGKSEPDYELENHRTSHSSEEIGCSSTSYADNLRDSKSSSNPTSTRWSYKDFQPDEMWAVYGKGTGTMPRSYVKVVGVTSFHQVKVTFLEINPMLEAEIRWVEDNLPFACGVFRAGTKTTNLDIMTFSHPVKCDRSTKKNFFRVFPRKGEVWAMYKDWNNKWTASDYVKAECYVVEILSDYSMDNCISTCTLVEVDGYLTFFKRRLFEGSMLFKKFLRMDFLCFSHRIPAYNVVGIEDPSIPNEAWHLEPDALPPKYEDGFSSNLCKPVTNQIPVT